MIIGVKSGKVDTVTIGQKDLTEILEENKRLKIELEALRNVLLAVMDVDAITRAVERMKGEDKPVEGAPV